MRVLVVTAVAAEADSVAAGLVGFSGPAPHPSPRTLPSGHTVTTYARGPLYGAPSAPGGDPADRSALVDLVAVGVGPAAAAVGTTAALAGAPYPYDLVVSAGIGGGFTAHAPLGSVVVSDAIVAADLGAQTPDGYLAVEELGFGRSTHLPPDGLPERLARALAAGKQRHVVAPVLTLSTVTGTAAQAAELARRHPRAAAEAMEGFGVAEAATAHGVPVVEIRAVSNAVGPRDRAAWRIGQAMESLRYAFQLISPTVFLATEAP